MTPQIQCSDCGHTFRDDSDAVNVISHKDEPAIACTDCDHILLRAVVADEMTGDLEDPFTE